MRTIEHAAAGMRSDAQLRALRIERARSKRKQPVTEAQVAAFKTQQARDISYVRVLQAEVN